MLGMLLFGGGSVAGQHHAAIILAPDEVTWGAPLPNGAKIAVMEGNPQSPGPFTMRVILPANWTSAPHVHRGVEHLTVLSGTFYVGHGERFDASHLKALPAGGFMVMPANTPMFAMVREETTIQIHSVGPWEVIYVNPADDPAKK
jgi:quercetin dioxygenase-like cupin family protein